MQTLKTSVCRVPAATGILLICFGAMGPCLLNAAPASPRECKDLLDGLYKSGPPSETDARDALEAGQAAGCIWKIAFADKPLIRGASRASVATALRKSANATQTGAQTGAAGTTSAISLPGTPFSLATEYGGITSSTKNQTVTFQIPLDGIPRALATHGDLPYCSTTLISFQGCISKRWLDNLNRVGFTVSMNTSAPANSVMAAPSGPAEGNAQPVSAISQTGSGPSFSGASVKVAIVRATATLPTISMPTKIAAGDESVKQDAVNLLLGPQSRYGDWQTCVSKALAAAHDRMAADAVYARYFTQLKDILRSGMEVGGCDGNTAAAPRKPAGASVRTLDQNDLLAEMTALVQAIGVTEANFDADINSALATPVLSFEWDLADPQNQQTNSTFKLVGSKGWGMAADKNTPPPWTTNLNIGASIFNSNPSSSVPGASLLRSLQVGVEVDYVVATHNLPGWLGKIGDSTASLAYYYQDQTSPSILNVTPGSPLAGITLVGLPSTATQIFTQKGPIQVGQFKYGFGTGKNVKFPISVTYSSRTELIVHPTWSAQFGVSYDFTSLLPSGSGGTQ